MKNAISPADKAKRAQLQATLQKLMQRLAAVERVLSKNATDLEGIKEDLWEFRVHISSLHARFDEIASLLRAKAGTKD